jgi:hypothetical protein
MVRSVAKRRVSNHEAAHPSRRALRALLRMRTDKILVLRLL